VVGLCTIDVMHDHASWSLNLGRWGGVRVRLHVFFLLFAVAALYLYAERSHWAPGVGDPRSVGSTEEAARQPTVDALDDRYRMPLAGFGMLALTLLLASVLLHEMAHTVAVRHVGGAVDQLVLGPLGGLTRGRVPHEPQCELIAALAGPLANLLVTVALVPWLALVSDVPLQALLYPLVPQALSTGTAGAVALKLAFWLNWSLALISLLPADPFDGGLALRAVLWPLLGYRTAVLAVARTAKLAALGLCLLAWLMRYADGGALVPAWLPLLSLGVFLYFSANRQLVRPVREQYDDELFGVDFVQGWSGLARRADRPDPSDQIGLLARWREKRRLTRLRERRQQEVDEEAQVDAILAQVHQAGMASLAAKDRALLERVSARYRNRPP
jgi:Zn-dependent protease